ncbi:MAG: sigma-70 family RNA polymerase sigma factor [Gemmatimonadales bacterium]
MVRVVQPPPTSMPLASSSVSPVAEPDRGLLARVARGEESALSALYDRHAATLYALAYRISGESADADEIVLDSVAQVWREAGRFQSARGSVIAWLMTICRSRALDLVRARGRRAGLASSAAAAEPGSVPAMGAGQPSPGDTVVLRSERCRVVAGALEALPPPLREAIRLAYWEGLSQSEIAERLGEPLGTIKTRVRSAMHRLRDVLRPYYYEPSL